MVDVEFTSALGVDPELAFDRHGDSNHAVWAARVRDRLWALLRLDLAPVLEVRKLEERSGEDLTCTQYLFAGPHRQVRGTLLRPRRPILDSSPAVLVCFGLNGQLEHVTGEVTPDYPDRNVAEDLAQRGFTTLALDHALVRHDGTDPQSKASLRRLSCALSLIGSSPLEWVVKEQLAALKWLQTSPDLAVGTLGIFGHSFGGHVALHVALASGMPCPLALASCVAPYRALFAETMQGSEAHALPGILRHVELADLLGALAPAPLHIQHGTKDPLHPLEHAREVFGAIRRCYRANGSADHLEIAELDMGHGTSVAAAANFFQREFAVRRAEVRPQAPVPAAKIHFDLAARRQILSSVDESLRTGELTLGRLGKTFEQLARAWSGAHDTVAVSSGTAALEIALRVIGVEGRKVIVPANTFFATAAAAVHAGAEVCFGDMETTGLGLCPESAEVLLRREDVAAIVTVHIGGIVSPAIEALLSLSQRYGVPLLEDAAHAFGSRLGDGLAGSFGRMATFSVYPTKIITSGEGGIIAGKFQADLEAARCYRDQGKLSFDVNEHGRLGNNWRLSEFHAAVGIAHIERLAAFVEERRRLAAFYDEALAALSGVRAFRVPARSASNYYKYIALLDPRIDRARLKERLRTVHGVQLAGEVYAMTVPDQPYFRESFGALDVTRAKSFSSGHICLPLFQGMTRQQQQRVVDALEREVG